MRVEFGIECVRSIRCAGMRLSVHKGERSEEAYDEGWKKIGGIHLSDVPGNPVRFGTATHYRIVECGKDLKKEVWLPLTKEAEEQLKELTKSHVLVKDKRLSLAEKWISLESYDGVIPQDSEIVAI